MIDNRCQPRTFLVIAAALMQFACSRETQLDVPPASHTKPLVQPTPREQITLNISDMYVYLRDTSYTIEFDIVNEGVKSQEVGAFWWYFETDSIDFSGDRGFEPEQPIGIFTIHTGDPSLSQPLGIQNEQTFVRSDTAVLVNLVLVRPQTVVRIRLVLPVSERLSNLFSRGRSMQMRLPVYRSDVVEESDRQYGVDTVTVVTEKGMQPYGKRDFFVRSVLRLHPLKRLVDPGVSISVAAKYLGTTGIKSVLSTKKVRR